ncbi:penicillin-binding transpeptidase domain-containing protein [Anaerovorax odorimutans]|uniref:penicillin-binding transpeptidase domain-containing protein n=1 Tax=Anaerovorax odorimutans TaxID=109327 RepID=UPI00041AA172|nr:penicillin-binding transpeptidase domain-containing protein [Anaerovorax odorimutans]
MNDLKIITKRALGVLILSLLLVIGLIIFSIKYTKEASDWAQYPANKHIYANGQLMNTGTIYDRNGKFLFKIEEGSGKYNENKLIRESVMHAVGDSGGNIITSARVVFADRLNGWDFLNGSYRFNNKLSKFSSDVKLTLDADLCATAYKALNGRKGTVGVYNYKTGEILCMVSSPSFDPMNPPDIDGNPEKYEGVYINRFLSATYTPGSIFKLVTAAAAIDNIDDIDSKTYHCEGNLEINGKLVTCMSSHGDITFKEALAESCNIAFAEISLDVGANTLQKYAEKAGFNSSLEVNDIKTAVGKVDLKEAKGADLAWAGIGQYTDLANPLNFMTYVGAIANDGVRISPRIRKDNILSNVCTSVTGKKRILSKETADKLGDMMRNDVMQVYGENNYKGLELCAKSGTAEVGNDKKPHAWFVGYMDREDCPLAFAVIVENGGLGGTVAGPVAATVLQKAVDLLQEE